MKAEIYQWMKNLAVFYILFTSVLHLIPDRKYERYVRFFMGLLLILMLCTPVFSLLGRGEELAEIFSGYYRAEAEIQNRREILNLQEMYLQSGYEYEIRQKIFSALHNVGINPADVIVHIEGERAAAIIYMEGEVKEEEERGIKDALWSACGIGEGEYQIQITEDDGAAVADPDASGAAPGGDRAAGIS